MVAGGSHYLLLLIRELLLLLLVLLLIRELLLLVPGDRLALRVVLRGLLHQVLDVAVLFLQELDAGVHLLDPSLEGVLRDHLVVGSAGAHFYLGPRLVEATEKAIYISSSSSSTLVLVLVLVTTRHAFLKGT